jgi:hypothetical protein
MIKAFIAAVGFSELDPTFRQLYDIPNTNITVNNGILMGF